MKFIILCLASAVLLSGCQSAGTVRSADTPPDWVLKIPQVEGMICSVGMSDPTFYEEDAKINSAEIARRELAKTLSIEIRSIMIDIATERGGSVDEGTVMQVSSWATNAVVRNAKIIEYWQDSDGAVSQKKNSAYALGCMPRKFEMDNLKTELVRSQKKGDANLQDISRTVEEIIRQLEGFD